jgi:hypothetical protein
MKRPDATRQDVQRAAALESTEDRPKMTRGRHRQTQDATDLMQHGKEHRSENIRSPNGRS